jgi:hypothetical protein
LPLPKLLLLYVLSGSFVPLPCHAQISEIYPSRAPLITGECEADLKPSVAVISGGVATSALKPYMLRAKRSCLVIWFFQYGRLPHQVLRAAAPFGDLTAFRRARPTLAVSLRLLAENRSDRIASAQVRSGVNAGPLKCFLPGRESLPTQMQERSLERPWNPDHSHIASSFAGSVSTSSGVKSKKPPGARIDCPHLGRALRIAHCQRATKRVRSLLYAHCRRALLRPAGEGLSVIALILRPAAPDT